jgi:competence protein ComEA
MFKKILAALLACYAAAAFAAVDINKANQAELEAVKGVGTATAGKIIDERKKGSFKDWADVMQRVGGIKDAKAGKLSTAGLTVNGAGFTASPTSDGKPAKGKKAKAEKTAKAQGGGTSETRTGKAGKNATAKTTAQ